jgi:spoIIIJ-associated protein
MAPSDHEPPDHEPRHHERLDVEKVRPQLEEFLGRLLRAARIHLKFRIEPGPADGPEILVQFDGEDVDLLLGRGAELLVALEHLSAKFLRLPAEEQYRISFDCHDYKSLHEDELRLMATTAAERVSRTGAPFAMNPMNSRERRIVHLALKENPAVRTESEGTGPGRKVVIYPQKQK